MDIASAIDVLRARIEAFQQEPSVSGKITLIVITGSGIHSTKKLSGVSQVKYYVICYLNIAGLRFEEEPDNPGLLKVSLSV